MTVARDEVALAKARAELADEGQDAVVEQYVDGPSLSLEVLAWHGRVVPLVVTGLEFDAVHDCKRVVAPVGEAPSAPGEGAGPGAYAAERYWARAVAPGTAERLVTFGRRLAAGLGLNGVMDVEVVVGEDADMRVLEIDARLPSQTPTVVLWSSGLNIVELLVGMARYGVPGAVRRDARRACVYQHIQAREGRLAVVGEHALVRARPLSLVAGFYGADEALTDRDSTGAPWVATLIVTGTTTTEAAARAARVVERIARLDGLDLRPESLPAGPPERP